MNPHAYEPNANFRVNYYEYIKIKLPGRNNFLYIKCCNKPNEYAWRIYYHPYEFYIGKYGNIESIFINEGFMIMKEIFYDNVIIDRKRVNESAELFKFDFYE